MRPWRRNRAAVPVIDDRLVGKTGRVTVPVHPDRTGEVMIEIRGGSECFAAFSDQPIAKGREVVVVQAATGRSVVVTPFPS